MSGAGPQADIAGMAGSPQDPCSEPAMPVMSYRTISGTKQGGLRRPVLKLIPVNRDQNFCQRPNERIVRSAVAPASTSSTA